MTSTTNAELILADTELTFASFSRPVIKSFQEKKVLKLGLIWCLDPSGTKVDTRAKLQFV